MNIINFTKDDNDIEGIAWVSAVVLGNKSDLFHLSRVEITDAADGSVVVGQCGSMLFRYETREEIQSGYYEVLKATKTTVVLHKDKEILEGKSLFPDHEGIFNNGIPEWQGQVSDYDKMAVSKSYTDVVRNLPEEHTIVFELFATALSGPGLALASVYIEGEDCMKTAVELDGGRCRALVMTAKTV